MTSYTFGQPTAAAGTAAPQFSFGANTAAQPGASAFGAAPAASAPAFGAQPAFGAGAIGGTTFGTTGTTFGAPASNTTFGGGFGAAKPAFGSTFGATNAINAGKPQAVQLSQQDLYMSPEEHAKRLSVDLQRQAGEFQQIADNILQQDKRNFDIYQDLEQFALLLDQLNDRQTQQKQQIAQIAAAQKQLYQELSAKPVNTDSKVAHVARMLVEVEAEIERASAGAVDVLRDIQEQAVVLERLVAASQ